MTQPTLPEGLDSLIRILTECNSVRELADGVAGLIIGSTHAENTSIMLLDGDSGKLITAGAAARRSLTGADPSGTFNIGEGIAGWVAENNIPIRLVDASKDRRFLHSDSSQPQIRSLFVHPITAGDRMLGVMSISSPLPGALNTDDEHQVELVCGHIGNVLERASELDRYRAKRIQSETLLSAGSLLAGIVHEINNPLTTILGFSELMLREHAGNDDRLVRINAEAARCVRITQNVLKLGRQASGRPQAVDVHEAIRQAAELSRHQLLLHGISLTLNLSDVTAKTLAHEGELAQVFLNLMTNAIQAISSAQRPGNVIISSAAHEDRIRISVMDDGPGVSSREMERIFQPFFTTKQNGNGIGLSLSRKIVQDLGGEMWVSPNLRRGATFTVDLPLTQCEREIVSVRPANLREFPRTGRSVLIVDDEEPIVNLVDAIVRDQGFTSTCCTDGQNALALMEQNEYDLLICDYHMPGTSGRELMESIRASGRTTKVLVMSGDIVRSETRELVEQLQAQFLSKPFGLDDLVTAIDLAVGL